MVEKMLRYLEASNPKIAGATREDAAPKRAARATSSLLRLSILVGFGSGEAPAPAPGRSPRSFDAGAVGLGIVAAMSCGGGGGGGAVVTKPAAAAAMARAEPIAIGRTAAAKRARTREEMELSESYTCVISHVGGNRVRKRVYFGNGYVGAFYDDDDVDDHHLAGRSGVTSGDGQAPPPPPPPPGDFLSKCYLCNRKLDGLDVYMYRGEKAFCSAECRCQQMLTDECWENCGSIAMKSYENSPCSAPMKLFSSGVAVA